MLCQPAARDTGFGLYIALAMIRRWAPRAIVTVHDRWVRTPFARATVDALWALGHATAPRLLEILESLIPLVGSPDEADAIDYIYRAYHPVAFARDQLTTAAAASSRASCAARG